MYRKSVSSITRVLVTFALFFAACAATQEKRTCAAPVESAIRTLTPLSDLTVDLGHIVPKHFLPNIVGSSVLDREDSIAVDCSSCVLFYDLRDTATKPFRIVPTKLDGSVRRVSCDRNTMIEYSPRKSRTHTQPLHVTHLAQNKSTIIPLHSRPTGEHALSARGNVVALAGSVNFTDRPLVDHFLDVYQITDGKSLAQLRLDDDFSKGSRRLKEIEISRLGDYVLIRDGKGFDDESDDRAELWDWRRERHVALEMPKDIHKFHRFEFVDNDRVLLCLCERKSAGLSSQIVILAWELTTIDLCAEVAVPGTRGEYFCAYGSVTNVVASFPLLQGTRNASRFCMVDLVENSCKPQSDTLDLPALYEPTFVGRYCVSRRSNGTFDILTINTLHEIPPSKVSSTSELDHAIKSLAHGGHEFLSPLRQIVSAGDHAVVMIEDLFRRESMQKAELSFDLLAKLDNDDPNVRRAGLDELNELGSRVELSVRVLLKRKDLTSEVRNSLDIYLRGVSALGCQSLHDRHTHRLIWALDLINTPMAKAVLVQIKNDQSLPELTRILVNRTTDFDLVERRSSLRVNP